MGLTIFFRRDSLGGTCLKYLELTRFLRRISIMKLLLACAGHLCVRIVSHSKRNHRRIYYISHSGRFLTCGVILAGMDTSFEALIRGRRLA